MRLPWRYPNACLKQAEPAGRMGMVIETLVLQALAFQGKKETDQALAALERALALAQPEGYVRSFLDEGEAMTRLLCQAQSRQVGSRLCGRAAVQDWQNLRNDTTIHAALDRAADNA